MKLRLERTTFTDKSTIGALYVNGVFHCWTLEDKDRKLEDGGEKVYGKTAIPRGSYEIVITYSNRFRRELPLLKGVKGFDGIRIHTGNTDADTEGCILVGAGIGADRIFNSRVTFDTLFSRLDAAYAKGDPITMEIV